MDAVMDWHSIAEGSTVIAAGFTAVATAATIICAQIGRMAKLVKEIRAEFSPNGGSSMRDLVAKHGEQLSFIVARQWAIVDGLGDPMWESDSRGMCVRANRALSALLRRSRDELLGTNWELCVHPADRERVLDAWADAVDRKRAFEGNFRVVDTSGKVYCIDAAATPIVQGQIVSGWIGRYRRVLEEKQCLAV
jgi:PAS domain S-box-containing protein